MPRLTHGFNAQVAASGGGLAEKAAAGALKGKIGKAAASLSKGILPLYYGFCHPYKGSALPY
jgi:hypothetical protein